MAGDGDHAVLKDFAVHLKHSRLRKVTFEECKLTSVDVAILLAEGLSENSTLEQLHIGHFTEPKVSIFLPVCVYECTSPVLLLLVLFKCVVSLMTLYVPH